MLSSGVFASVGPHFSMQMLETILFCIQQNRCHQRRADSNRFFLGVNIADVQGGVGITAENGFRIHPFVVKSGATQFYVNMGISIPDNGKIRNT